MIRTPEALMPYLLAIAMVLGGVLWRLGDRTGGLGRVVTVGDTQIGGPYALIDQNGAPRGDKDFPGQWQLIYFGYTHCPDVCPLTLEMIGEVMGRLGPQASRITPIFITIDPARDTPKVMKAYAAAFGKRFVGLTGDPRSIATVEKEFRVYARRRDLPGGDYAMDHSGVVYLMDPGGQFVMDYDGVGDPQKITDDIKKRL